VLDKMRDPRNNLATSGSPNPIVRTLALVGSVLWAVVQAAFDTGRAWVIAPLRYRRSFFARNENGGLRLRHRRRFRRMEVLRHKVAAAKQVLVASLSLRVARSVVITRYPEEGLLANLLHVLEVLHRVRSDASVHIDWVLTGTEIGFRYGDVGDNIWPRLFAPLALQSPATAHQAVHRIDFAFWGTGKDHLTGRQLQQHRQAYYSTLLQWVEITNKRVLDQVNQICTLFDGRFCIGIHRRVGNAGVADLQSDGMAPSLDSFIKSVESIVSIAPREGIPDFVIFLATDDTEAVVGFKRVFGSRLIVQDNIQRTTADAVEVHFREWERLSITDAEDVLIDTVVLSKCNVLVHASSSVSTAASIMNPALILVRA
jgi:hypothetical protein